MVAKNFACHVGVLVLGLCLATATHAATFSVTGGGAAGHIGDGLALPIQQAAKGQAALGLGPGGTAPPQVASGVNGGVLFPGEAGTTFEMQAPIKGKPLLRGTLVKPFQSAGGKQGYQRQLTVPAGAISKLPGQTTVGVKFSNPAAIAVGTNLRFIWPAGTVGTATRALGQTTIDRAIFSTGRAIGGAGVVAPGPAGVGSMTYSNALSSRFGGPAQFAVTGVLNTGKFPTSPVTVYVTLGGGSIPGGCCPGAGTVPVVGAMPTGRFGPGGATSTTVNTPGIALAPNKIVAAFGATPSGTLISTGGFAGTQPLPLNNATSQGAPWTTGRIQLTNGLAFPNNETFTMSGNDGRDAQGGGSIQMVAGALSNRGLTGPNANRAWVQLDMVPFELTPALSPVFQFGLGGLMLLGGGFAARRRFAKTA